MAHAPRSQVSPRTVWTVGLNVLGMLALLMLLRAASGVLSWVLVALFLALAAHPLVAWMERRGLRRGMSVGLVFLSALGGMAALLTTFVPMMVEQARALVEAAPGYLESMRHWEWLQRLDERYGVFERMAAELRQRLPGAAMPVLGVVTGLLHRLAAFITIMVLAAFFLAFGKDLFDKALLWVPPRKREHTRKLASRMNRTVGRYVAGSFLISLIGGGVTTVTLLLLDVPYFLPLGLAMAVLGLIPFIGAFLGGMLVVGTTFASAGTRAGVITLIVFLVYQQVENHLLQPFIQRRTLHMNPLLIALAMLVGTAFAGVLGALLALPVAGAVQVVAQDRLARRQELWRISGEQENSLMGSPPPTASDGESPEARH
ncbi:AI-2E family transporter [Hyalangium rubrum]|uniref:AI-2E family transporter n=1 Tax=Hyalangium rubrum TaxID=3103134 RepID=A0ABU5HGU1_9BACT|nr:AI-2E family transporter [Hyalangium sp. s54d21]MDY7232372.1 AI-2E family transporter [Hyalangium sp. s54d21]